MILARRTRFFLLTALVAVVVAGSRAESTNDELIVHEWGTFTELHNEAGVSVGGINTDDEPVPEFVHRIGSHVLQSTNEPWRSMQGRRGKSILWNNNVRTRLETPVIYFYPPQGLKEPLKIDVDVQLRGGWLSEYYPNAEVNAPGLQRNELGKHAVGTLTWRGLEIGVPDVDIPQTTDQVWIAPRLPNSAVVRTPEGEAEEYLFYRGVGNFAGPLRVETDLKRNRLRLRSRFHTLQEGRPMVIPAAWLVSVSKDGSLAFRILDAMEVSDERSHAIRELDSEFFPEDHTEENRRLLWQSMHAALVEDGLFGDEATAMLSTWRRAYFESPGLRLFYVMPEAWTNDRMPLTLSVPARIERVMVGRIELITNQQRKLVEEIANQPRSSRDWMKSIPRSEARDQFFAGDNEVASELGVEMPSDFKAYLKLGRFRNAILHNEIQRTRNHHLLAFANTHGLVTPELRSLVFRH